MAVNFVNGTMLLVEPGMTGATGNIYAGLHEFNDMAFALHLLRTDDLFVDVGANVGSYTVLAASVGAKCISIEPIAATFNHLVRNVHLNNMCDRVDVRNIGVGSAKGTLRFTSNLDTVNHVIDNHEQSDTTICEVAVDTVDSVVADAQPVLVKIDVEGFETEVIAGAEKVLSRETLLAVIMELNGSGQRYNYDEGELYNRMINFGFNAYSYSPFERSLKAFEAGRGQSGNTIFVKDVDAVRERLHKAPRFTVNGESV